MTWRSASTKRFFTQSILAEFEEFLLANSDWKVEQFATVRYADWWGTIVKEESLTSDDNTSLKHHANEPDHAKHRKYKQMSLLPKGAPVIEIEDNCEDNSATAATVAAPNFATPTSKVTALMAVMPTLTATPITTTTPAAPTMTTTAMTATTAMMAMIATMPITSTTS
ncbi:hypothetical protein H2248_005409 [Termitomyces sp. 'cryptogamus']|nr:hypothetical protein H2248_005409 [Termitomyces sp. 'cryptogamus']